MYFHFIDTTLVTAPLKRGGQKDVEDFNGHFGRGVSRSETKDVGVVVLAAERGHRFIEDQCGARAGDFVGRDADANSRRTDQQAIDAFPSGDLLGHGVAEFGVIARFRGMRPQVHQRNPAGLQVALEMFLEGKAGMIGAERDAALRRAASPGRLRRLGGLIHEFKHRENPLLDLVAAIGVSFVGAADGIADVLLVIIQRLVKFAQ